MATRGEQPQFIVSPGNEFVGNSNSSHVRLRLIDSIDNEQIIVSEVCLLFNKKILITMSI